MNVSYHHRSTLPSVDGDTYYDAQFADDDAIYDDQNASDILKLILYDLNSAIAPRDLRLMAIQAALDEFDHDDEVLHDEELELRADHILLQKLTYALSIDPTGMEVGHICSALECVYRGGRARLAQSFHEICDVLLPLFVDMIRPPPGYNPANILLQRKSMTENTVEGGGVDNTANEMNNDMKLDMIQENYSDEKLHYGDDDDDESAESVAIPLAPSEYFENTNRRPAGRTDADSVSIPPGTGDYLAELKRRISGDKDSGGNAISSLDLVDARNIQTTTVVAANEYQRDWPNDMSSIVPVLSSINASDQQHAIVLHQMNNQPSIATEAGPDVIELNAMILMELEDAKKAMSNVTESGQPNLTSHNADNYLTSAPLATTDQYGHTGSDYQGVVEDPMALRGGGDEDVEGDEDDDDDVMPMTFDHLKFQHEDDLEDSQDNPFSDSSSFSTSFRSHGDGSRSSFGATSRRMNMGEGDEQQGNAYDASSYVSEDNSNLVADEQYESERDNASTQNPFFSESSPYRNIDYDGGDSSVYSGSIHGGGYGSDNSVLERDEDSISRFPKMDNFNERGRDGNDSQYYEESVTDSQVEESGSTRNPFSESLRYRDSQYEESVTDSQVGESESTRNPFSESLRYRDRDYASSVYSGSIHDGGYGSEHGMAERDEDSIRRYPKMDNFNELGRNGIDPQYEESVTDSQVAPGFDEYGGFAPPSIYGYDDETYVDADGRSEYHEADLGQYANNYNSETLSGQRDGGMEPGLRGQYAEDTKQDIYSTNDLREQYYSAYEEEKLQDGEYSVVEDDANLRDADEDIFHFQEPKMFTTDQDYFNYSDPIESKVCPLAVRKVLKTLRYFSRVLSAMEPMAQQQGLVDACLYHMTKKPLTVDYDDEIASRVDAIAVMVNLACAEENKIMLVYHPGLLDAVINVSNHDPIDEAREHAAIVLMNLAYAEENKVHMVNQDHLLDTLVHLLSDVSPFTRRYASAALFTLACTYANTSVMARHCNGGILEALRKVLLNDPIDEARVNAAEALFNMARNSSSGDETVESMGNHPRLLASLSHSVLTDYSADVRAYSARALEWLSADIHHPMACHRILLKALTLASQWTKTTCIAEALKMQASLSENRKAMVEHPGLLDALATLALLPGITDYEVKTCAISAIERLSKEASTRHIMVRNSGIMTALTTATFAKDDTQDDEPEEGTPTALLMKTALKNLVKEM